MLKGTVNGPNEKKHGQYKKRLCAREENLLHKLKSLIIPAL